MKVDIKIRINFEKKNKHIRIPGGRIQGENVMALSFLAQDILKFQGKGGFP